MSVLAGVVGVFAICVAFALTVFGNAVALSGSVHGPNWEAAAIISWVAIGLLVLGVFAFACAHAIDEAQQK